MTVTASADAPATLPTPPPTMRAVVAGRYGSPEVLSIDEVPVPEPAANEVLVRVAATSLNALDWHYLTGTPYFMRLMVGLRRPKRTIHGADVAGTVIAVGADVTRFVPGDAVFGLSGGGGCAEYLVVDEEAVVARPPEITAEAAAATPVAGLTAAQALRTHADVRPGDRVLVNGAAGGVGTFAVQIAKALGAEVTAVCSERNVDMVRTLGADEVIDYGREDFVDGDRRFDVMVDNVGNRTPAECRSVLLPGARFVLTSGPKENRLLGPIPHIARTALSLRRADASFHQFTASANDDDLAFLAGLIASGQVTPAIDRVVGLDGVMDGLTEIGTGHTRAKIVVVPG